MAPNLETEESAETMLTFLIEMMHFAKEYRSKKGTKGTHTPYTQRHKDLAIEVVRFVEANGGSLKEAAYLLSMHTSTLKGWAREYETLPELTEETVKSRIDAVRRMREAWGQS